jgi:hypothetical protein
MLRVSTMGYCSRKAAKRSRPRSASPSSRALTKRETCSARNERIEVERWREESAKRVPAERGTGTV